MAYLYALQEVQPPRRSTMAQPTPSKDQQVAVYYEAATGLFHVRVCLRGDEAHTRSEFSSLDAEEAMEWACDLDEETPTAMGVCNYDFPAGTDVPDVSNAAMSAIREETARLQEELGQVRDSTARLKWNVDVLRGTLERYRDRRAVTLKEHREIQGCIRAVRTETQARL
jgi:hypothetical protein